VDSQRRALAMHGIDHDDYEVFLSNDKSLDEETTSVMVRRIGTGETREKTINMSRRQLAEEGDTTYIDTIVELCKELEASE
jgi:hypothetical protein